MDEDEQTEVFRVPRHNQVNATEVMNDFAAVIYARIHILTVLSYFPSFKRRLPVGDINYQAC